MIESSQELKENCSPEFIKNNIQNLQRALFSAEEKSQKWIAWQELNTIDEKGSNHVKPYTQEAIETLNALFTFDESDFHIIHHLAIAYHAKAWDLELQNPELAPEYWEKALYYWQKLLSSGNFWQELFKKGSNLGIEFDENKIKDFRQNLLFYILEIHIEFIRHYLEINQVACAHRHINLIKRSRIPPAIRNKLEDFIYEAMTCNIKDIIAEERYEDALNIFDDFLNFLPLYLPALQSYLENAKQWLEQLSPSHNWQQISRLDLKLFPKWETLSKLRQLSDFPLAQAVLVDVAILLGKKYYIKARSLRSERQEKLKEEVISLADEELKGYDRSIFWLKNSSLFSTNESEIEIDLYNSLMSRAEFKALMASKIIKIEDIEQLFDQAFIDCQEVMKIFPAEVEPRKFGAKILQLKIISKCNYIPKNLKNQDYASYIKKIEEDLEKAIQLDPNNTTLLDFKKLF